MEIKKDYSAWDLVDELWGGADDWLKKAIDRGYEDDVMNLLEEIFTDTPDLTEVNDFIRFDIERYIDLDAEEDDDEDDEDDEEEDDEE